METISALLISFSIAITFYSSISDATCEYDKDFQWSYDANLENGPEHWGKTYMNCSGKHQSPINIITANVRKDGTLKTLELENYDKPLSIYLFYNNGWMVNVSSREEEKINRTVMVHGEKYNLSYIEFHWGDKYYRGSEHTVDNIQYALEIQFVHTNQVGKKAIVAVLFESSLFNNTAFSIIVNNLRSIPYRGYQLVNDKLIDLSKLVRNGCSFYRYSGSLTSPTCDEGVIWSICKNPGTIGYKQLDEFRKLFRYVNREGADLSDCKLINNFRPVQPLNDRTVTSSA